MNKIFLAFWLLPLFISCDHSTNNKDSNLSSQDLVTEQQPSPKPGENDNKKIEKQKTFTDSTGTVQPIATGTILNQIDWDKKIIKTADILIEVKDFKLFSDVVGKATKQYGGYIASEEQNQSEQKIESAISIKVPVDKFEGLLNQLPQNDSKIIERKISTADVTGEVVDTKSRLQAKEQMRLKYLEFLKQSKNMQDVLNVQREINSIQEEIESASGRINYLSHQSVFSTINLTFYQPLPGYVPINRTPAFSFRIIDAFKTGLHFITEIFIGVISIWPLLLIIIIGWLSYKKRRMSLTASKQTL